MNTTSNVQDEIIEALKMNPEDVPYQGSLPPEQSPLNYPVAEREFEEPPRQEEPVKEVDNGHAMMMAEVILSAANNIIEVGGGFFLKIKTDASFLDYEELIQVIDDQNQRNIKRLTLDEGDKAMLRPLLAEVLKAREKVLSPEHQLLIAGASILIKKAQLVMEVRAENQILTDRIRSIIQEESEPKAEQPESSPDFHESRVDGSNPQNIQDQTMETLEIPADPIKGKEESNPEASDSNPSEYKLSRQDRRKAEREARKNDKINSDRKQEQKENEKEPEPNESKSIHQAKRDQRLN